jgi:hypothetical protein
VGSFEIQNQGEFDANKIRLDLWASWQDPTLVKLHGPSSPPIGYGTLSDFKCSNPYTSTTIVPTTSPGNCVWDSTTYPKEVKVVNFAFEKDSWGNLAACVDYNKTSVGCNDPNATFSHASHVIKVNANLTYDYNVNVSIPVDVMDLKTYTDLLQSKQIALVDNITSQYTGGPVKATLWSQRQPIRTGETSLFVASIYNDGQGIISRVSLTIKILDSLINTTTSQGELKIIGSTFYTGTITGPMPTKVDGCPAGVISHSNEFGYYNIVCNHYLTDRPIKPGEYVRVSFTITPVADLGVDRISRLIVGLANYEYIKTFSKSITIANNPWP